MTGKSSSTRRILAIVNPAAGGGRGARRFGPLRGELEKWPGQLQVSVTAKTGDAERLASEATADGMDIVVAVGGDGTVHEVVNGILAADSAKPPALALIPVGTGCDFTRGLGLPARVSAAEPGRIVRVDVGRVRWIADGATRDRFFLNSANMGASTAAARRIKGSGVLKRIGSLAYLVAGIPEVLARPMTEFVWAEPGGPERTEHLLNLSLCNGPRFGGGLMLAPEATVFDGRLHLARFRRGSLFGLLRTLAEGYSTRPEAPRGVDLRRVTALRVEGAATIEADGEILGCLPADFSVLPQAIEVLLP